eukprot:Skav205870  [mRNA]  locus=scaffold766:197855:199698:+ [translate_table: standard]
MLRVWVRRIPTDLRALRWPLMFLRDKLQEVSSLFLLCPQEIVAYVPFPEGHEMNFEGDFQVALFKQAGPRGSLQPVLRSQFSLQTFVAQHELKIFAEQKLRIVLPQRSETPETEQKKPKAFSSGGWMLVGSTGPLLPDASAPQTLTAALQRSAQLGTGLTLYDGGADYSAPNHAVCSKLCNVWQLLEQPPVITTAANLERLTLGAVDGLGALGSPTPGDTL